MGNFLLLLPPWNLDGSKVSQSNILSDMLVFYVQGSISSWDFPTADWRDTSQMQDSCSVFYNSADIICSRPRMSRCFFKLSGTALKAAIIIGTILTFFSKSSIHISWYCFYLLCLQFHCLLGLQASTMQTLYFLLSTIAISGVFCSRCLWIEVPKYYLPGCSLVAFLIMCVLVWR